MFIHELAQVTGVSAKTIRYYESIGLVPNPQRAENNYRQYAPDAGNSAAISSSFLRLSIFLVGRLRRPSAMLRERKPLARPCDFLSIQQNNSNSSDYFMSTRFRTVFRY